MNLTVLGVVGRGRRRTEIPICGVAFQSNHYHMLAVPESTQQLSEFMMFVNGNIARKVGRLQGWRGKLWDRRYQHITVSDEPEAPIGRLRYLLSQGVKEGLVRNPEDWPGVHCVHQLKGGYDEVKGGVWRDQTAEYYARRAGKVLKPQDFLFEEWVRLTPIPCFEELSRAERMEQVQELLREIDRLRRQRRQETGRAPLGKKRILLQVPDSRPKKVKRSPAPAFHAVARGYYEKQRERYWAFLDDYRDAAEKLRAGVIGVVFPAGCFPPRPPMERLRFMGVGSRARSSSVLSSLGDEKHWEPVRKLRGLVENRHRSLELM